jgi:hypothetical protein
MPENRPEMVPVVSSNLVAVGYAPATKELHVQFKSGRTYVHVDVPPTVHRGLMAAKPPEGSHGRYYNDRIKGSYTQYRLEK